MRQYILTEAGGLQTPEGQHVSKSDEFSADAAGRLWQKARDEVEAGAAEIIPYPEPVFSDLKAAKKRDIEAERDRQVNDPAVTVLVSGSIFQAGPRSMADLNDALTTFGALGGTPVGFEWRDQDNVNHPADLPLLAAIAIARAEQKNAIWQQSWALKDALDLIDADTGTQEQLDAIQWPEPAPQ